MRLNYLTWISILFISTNTIRAADESKENSKPKTEEKTKQKDLVFEVSGVLKKEEGNDKNQNYFILKEENSKVYLPKKIGDKEIDFTTLINKRVIAKGKGKLMSAMTTTGCIETMGNDQLLSIELEDETNKKVIDKKKDLGNQSKD